MPWQRDRSHSRTSFAALRFALPDLGVALLVAFLCAGIAGCGGGSGANTTTPALNHAAVISSITPSSVSTGGSPFTLTVNGSNFVSSSIVQWDGGNRPTTFVSSNQLTAQIGAADLASAATASVTVATPSGNSTNALTFTINDPLPAVSAIFPNTAPVGSPGFTVTVNGSNFVPGSNVEWNGSSRTTTFVSSSELQAQILDADMASPGKATVKVVNSPPGGGSSSSAGFAILANTIVFESLRALDGTDAANTNNTANIWTINPDGSGLTPLTKLTALNAGSALPVWSPDASKIAFLSTRALDGSDAPNSNLTDNIWMMNADGSAQVPLTKLTVVASFGPAWSPDGTKIAFTSTRALDGSDSAGPHNSSNVWVMNADGSGQAPLTSFTAAGAGSASPVWSPDGSKFAYSSSGALDGSDANNISNVWIMNSDGSGKTALTKRKFFGASFAPAWSPDGRQLAFLSRGAFDGSDANDPNSVPNIWVMNADGSSAAPLTRLTGLNTDVFSFGWSPAGDTILFTSDRDLDGFDAANPNFVVNLWVMNADGSSPIPLTRLTAISTNAVNPAWASVGSQILFDSTRALDGHDSANVNDTQNIWLMNADGTGQRPLTNITALGAANVFPQQP